MRATALVFRLRFWILVVVYTLGFWAPWDRWLHLDGAGPNAHLWGVLAAILAKTGALHILAAFNLLLVLAIVCAGAGAWLRTWGTAYLGPDVVQDTRMHGQTVVAAGPFRYMRNPLYVGTWLNTAALALLMPPSGAVFAVVGVVCFQLWLIVMEEQHLRERLGAAYEQYCERVPRIVPTVRPLEVRKGQPNPVAPIPPERSSDGAPGVPMNQLRPIEASTEHPHAPDWKRAALAEIYMWGSAVTFAAFGWQYNAALLTRGVLISLGLWLVVKGMLLDRSADGLTDAEAEHL